MTGRAKRLLDDLLELGRDEVETAELVFDLRAVVNAPWHHKSRLLITVTKGVLEKRESIACSPQWPEALAQCYISDGISVDDRTLILCLALLLINTGSQQRSMHWREWVSKLFVVLLAKMKVTDDSKAFGVSYCRPRENLMLLELLSSLPEGHQDLLNCEDRDQRVQRAVLLFIHSLLQALQDAYDVDHSQMEAMQCLQLALQMMREVESTFFSSLWERLRDDNAKEKKIILEILDMACFQCHKNQLRISRLTCFPPTLDDSLPLGRSQTFCAWLVAFLRFQLPLLCPTSSSDCAAPSRPSSASDRVLLSYPSSSLCTSLQCEVRELILAAFRCLTSVVNGCSEAADSLLRDGQTMTWLFVLVQVCSKSRCTSPDKVADSVVESGLKKFGFELLLQVLGFLLNLAELLPSLRDETLQRQLVDLVVNAPLSPHRFADLMALRSLLSAGDDAIFAPPLLSALIDHLLFESRVFMADLLASESPAANQSPGQDETSIPINEIVTSAYLSLLISQFIFTASDESALSKEVIHRVLNQLPKHSFWLCIRSVKAFIQLQGQTGVRLVAQNLPFVEAIKVMEQYEEKIKFGQTLVVRPFLTESRSQLTPTLPAPSPSIREKSVQADSPPRDGYEAERRWSSPASRVIKRPCVSARVTMKLIMSESRAQESTSNWKTKRKYSKSSLS